MSGALETMTPFFVEDRAGGEFEFVGEDNLFVHDAVAVGVGEDGDAVEGVALVLAGFEGTGVHPRGDVGFAEAVRVLGGFGDPEAALFIPVDVHWVVDERLGGDEGEF